jgi:hypothetical protein
MSVLRVTCSQDRNSVRLRLSCSLIMSAASVPRGRRSGVDSASSAAATADCPAAK